MKGESLSQFFHFISGRFGYIYPNEAIIFYLKQDTRVTHNRHGFKVENGIFLWSVDDYINLRTRLYIGMRFLLPTAKAIITVNLEYFGFISFTWLTNDEHNRCTINAILISHRHTNFSLIDSTYFTHRRRCVYVRQAWLGLPLWTKPPTHTLLLCCVKYFKINRSKFLFTVSRDKVWFVKSVYDYSRAMRILCSEQLKLKILQF